VGITKTIKDKCKHFQLLVCARLSAQNKFSRTTTTSPQSGPHISCFDMHTHKIHFTHSKIIFRCSLLTTQNTTQFDPSQNNIAHLFGIFVYHLIPCHVSPATLHSVVLIDH